MRLTFFWLALGWTAGILAGMFTPIQPVYFAGAFLFTIPFVFAFRGRRVYLPLFLLAVTALGGLAFRLDHRRPEHAVENYAGLKGKIQGIVKTRPQIKERGRKVMVSFVLSARWIEEGREGSYASQEVRGDAQVFLFQSRVIPKFGDRVEIFGEIERPKPALNPGEFDYQKYLARQDIYAVVKSFGRNSLTIIQSKEVPIFRRGLADFQDRIEKRIDTMFKPETAGILKALVTGTRKDINPEMRDDFVKTGTSHLLAISGLNIVLVAGTVYLLLLVSGMTQAHAAAAGLIVTLIYVMISGNGLPVQRAGWMAGAAFAAVILNREKHSLNLFFLAYFVMLVLDTRNLLNVSFQLSFLSVFSLMAFSKIKPAHSAGPVSGSFKLEGFWESLAAFAGTLPVVLYYFNVLSLTGLLANILAIPLFHFALLGVFAALFVGGVPVLGSAGAGTADFFTKLGLKWIHFWAQFDWGCLFLLRPAAWQMAAYYFFLGACLWAVTKPGWSKHRRYQKLALVCAGLWVICFASFFIPETPKSFSLTVFSAGKNEMMHLDLGEGGHWLLNTGRSFPSNQAEWILTPYFRAKSAKHFKGLILTDMMKKHLGGLETLKRNFKWEYLMVPKDASYEIFPEAYRMREGDCVRYLKSSICTERIIRGQMILTIRYDDIKILFLPDLNEWVMQWILSKTLPERVSYDYVITPSARTGPLFNGLLENLDPEVFIAPAMPEENRAILREKDILYWDPVERGAVTLEMSEKGPLIHSFLSGK